MKLFREWVMNPDEEELREAAQPKPKRGRKQGADAPADDAAQEGDVPGLTCALHRHKTDVGICHSSGAADVSRL